MKPPRKTKRALVMTVKGRAAAVVQDAESYQRLLDIGALADSREAIRQGLDEDRQGQGRDAEEVLAEIDAAKGFPR